MREDDPRQPPDASLDQPGQDPWSNEELDAARQFYTDFITQHGLSAWGTADDPLNAYKTLRQRGQSVDDARQGALAQLGWNDPAKWPSAAGGAPPAAGSGGSGGGSGAKLPPSLGSFLAPPMLDQGGPPGLSYLPPDPSFNAPKFNAPSGADALNEPGYQFRVQQGRDSLENWAAARGTLNDSSTAKSLIDYGQAAGEQGYADVWNRQYNQYQGDVNTWLQGTVNPGMAAWQTKAAAGEYQNTQNYLNAWNQFLNSQNNAKWWATV
jgi:hypothetical protein